MSKQSEAREKLVKDREKAQRENDTVKLAEIDEKLRQHDAQNQ